MKRIWFGAGLLVFLLVLGICSSFLIEKTCYIQSTQLHHAAVLALDSDWAAARTLTEQAKQTWDKQQFLFAAFFDHATLDLVEGLFAQLEVFSSARNAVYYGSTCAQLASQLESLGQSHNFTLKNLF